MRLLLALSLLWLVGCEQKPSPPDITDFPAGRYTYQWREGLYGICENLIPGKPCRSATEEEFLGHLKHEWESKLWI